jgi:sugar lactone lactonase YvrE
VTRPPRGTGRMVAAIVALLVASVVLYILLWPVPVQPVAWTAPPNPGYTGAHAPNERLSAMETVSIGDATGPEAWTRDRDGRLYAATLDGRILRFTPDGRDPTTFVNTGGRPLGMAFDSAGTMWVADAERGLLAIARNGDVRVVADSVNGTAIRLADDLDVAADGRVYFSDATTRFFAPRYDVLEGSLLEILEHEGTGRLLEHDPRTGVTSVLLDGIVFANGVAMSHDDRSVLVNETGSYRVLRVGRDGADRGRATTMVDALPGFPDNLKRGADGRYWIALISPRNALVDRLSGWPRARKMIQRLPTSVRPKPVNYGHVVAVDDSGRVVADLQDPSGSLPMISTAFEVGDYVYLGSLSATRAARVRWRGAP